MRYQIFMGLMYSVLMAARVAADSPLPVAVGGDLSTLGAGLSLTAPLQPNFLTAELDAAVIAYSHSVSSDGNQFSGTNHLVSVGLIGNVYPFGNALHVSAGGYYLDQHLPLDLHLTGSDYRVNGQSYTSTELTSLTGRVEYAHGAPYVGIGWGNPSITPGWHFSARLGVLYEGKPHVDFVGVTTLTGAQRNVLYSNLDIQRRALQSDLSSVPVYPVVGARIDYRF